MTIMSVYFSILIVCAFQFQYKLVEKQLD